MRSTIILVFALALAVIIDGINAQDSSTGGAAPPLHPSNGQPPVITRVSGCSDSGSMTLDCVRPVTLTLYGSGFMTGLEDNEYAIHYLSFDIEDSVFSYSDCVGDWQKENYNDTYLECNVANNGFGMFPTGRVLLMNMTNRLTLNSSASVPAISFRYMPPPQINSISGCMSVSPDGRTTFGCIPDIHFITLTGSGFSALNKSWVVLNLGGNSFYELLDETYATKNVDLTQFTDTTMVFAMNMNYNFLLPIEVYDTAPIPFNITNFSWYSNAAAWQSNTVYIQFAPLSLPVIKSNTTTSLIGSGCQWNSTTMRYVKCLPSGSQLSLVGNYFYEPVKVLIGDHECPINVDSNPILITCTLPMYSYQSNRAYDLSIETPAGKLTIANMFTFDAAPVIAKIIPCAESYAYFTTRVAALNCFGHETITMKVFDFNTDIVPVIQMKDNVNISAPIVQCTEPRYVDANTLTCVIPPRPNNPGWDYVAFTAVWPDQSKSLDYNVYQAFDYPDAPRIKSMSGCYNTATNGIRMNQCLSGDIITLTGERFDRRDWWALINGAASGLSTVNVINSTMLTFEAPNIDSMSWLNYNKEYSVWLYNYSWSEGIVENSNIGYLTFVREVTLVGPPSSNGGSNSSSSSTTTIVLATVFSIIGALLLIVAAVFISRVWRSKRSTSTGGSLRAYSSGQSEISSNVRHVELSEV